MGKCFDLLSHSLNLFFKELYGDQCGEFVRKYRNRVVQSRVKITRDWCKIWIQISKLKKQNQFYSFTLQFNDWMA